MSRYERQLPIVREEGQRRLCRSSVAVVGCGGLGTTVATMLSEAGVGKIILIDKDTPCESNFNRQFVYRSGDTAPKSELLGKWVVGLNPETSVDVRCCDFRDTDFSCDVIVDCLDSVKGRLDLSDLAFSKNIPLIHAAVGSAEGQLCVCIPGETPCLRCMIGYQKEYNGTKPSLGAVVSSVAAMEAVETIRFIIGETSPARGALVTFDFLSYSVDITKISSDSHCPFCSRRMHKTE